MKYNKSKVLWEVVVVVVRAVAAREVSSINAPLPRLRSDRHDHYVAVLQCSPRTQFNHETLVCNRDFANFGTILYCSILLASIAVCDLVVGIGLSCINI